MGSVVGVPFQTRRGSLHRATQAVRVLYRKRWRAYAGGALLPDADGQDGYRLIVAPGAGSSTLRLGHDRSDHRWSFSASLAMLGDLNIAEPRALIGFARRARDSTDLCRETLPEGFQRSEFLLEHGALDMIIDRRDMRDRISEHVAVADEATTWKYPPSPLTLPLLVSLANAFTEWLTLRESVHPKTIDMGLARVTAVARSPWALTSRPIR